MIEDTILSHILFNEEFSRKVIPFIREEYFKDQSDKLLFKVIKEYIDNYNTIPSKEALTIDLEKVNGISSGVFDEALSKVKSFEPDALTSLDWLVDNTEKFCQDAAIYNAIMESVLILDGKSKDKSKGAIPDLLSTALAVSFDTSVGHDYLEDAEARYDFYHAVEQKLPFDIDFLNKITKGGFSKKTLNVLMASCVHPSTKIKIRYRKK